MDQSRKWLLITFHLIYFIRRLFAFFVLTRNIKISEIVWFEMGFLPTCYASFYFGSDKSKLGFHDLIGIILYIFGSVINTYSEIQRTLFKNKVCNFIYEIVQKLEIIFYLMKNIQILIFFMSNSTCNKCLI